MSLVFVKLDNGIYLGQTILQGIRHGKGLMLYNDNSFYHGFWQHDVKHGEAVEYKSENFYFTGSFLQGEKSGFGIHTDYIQGEIYKGNWNKNLKCGVGIILYKDQTQFQGIFKNGKKHGYGLKTAKQMVYTGEYQNGEKNGVFEFKNIMNGKEFKVFYNQNKKICIQTDKKIKFLVSQNCLEKIKISKLMNKKRIFNFWPNQLIEHKIYNINKVKNINNKFCSNFALESFSMISAKPQKKNKKNFKSTIKKKLKSNKNDSLKEIKIFKKNPKILLQSTKGSTLYNSHSTVSEK